MDRDVLNGDLSINHAKVDRCAREELEHRRGKEPASYGFAEALPEAFGALVVPLLSLHIVSRDGNLASIAVLTGGLLFLAARKWISEAARKRWFQHYLDCRRDLLRWAESEAAELKRFAGNSSRN